MPIDLTQGYWDLVLGAGRAGGLGEVSQSDHFSRVKQTARCRHSPNQRRPYLQDEMRKLRSAQLLRSLGSKNTFTKAALEVVSDL